MLIDMITYIYNNPNIKLSIGSRAISPMKIWLTYFAYWYTILYIVRFRTIFINKLI